MSKITGSEPAMPVSYVKTDEGTVFNSADDNLGGLTIRQLALKDFMCAIIIAKGKDMKIPQAVVNAANDLTNAYIEQLNK